MKRKVNFVPGPPPTSKMVSLSCCFPANFGVTVEPVLFLYMLATFSQYALFQDLVYLKVCSTKYNSTTCSNLHNDSLKPELEAVQTESSHWILTSTTTMVIPSLLIAVYLGSWSDRFGRKWPIVIPPFGGALSCTVFIAMSFIPESSVGWIVLASTLSGLSGGFVSCIMSCMTYVAAVSTESNRTVRISRLEAMTFLGGTIGPFVSGSMLKYTGHGVAFCFMLVSYLCGVLYTLIFVQDVKGAGGHGAANEEKSVATSTAGLVAEGPLMKWDSGGSVTKVNESSADDDSNSPDTSVCTNTSSEDSFDNDEQRNIIRSSERRRSSQDVRGCCATYFGSDHCMDAMSTVFKDRGGDRRLYILLVVVASFIAMMTTAGELDVAYLFARDKPLAWDYQTYSYYFGGKYGVGAFVLLVGMPIFKKFNVDDTSVCIIGIVSRIAGLVVYGCSTSTFMAFTVPVWAIFSFFTIPATRSLLSQFVATHEQGKMFAFVAIMEDLCTLTASLLFNSVYPITRPIFGGLIFIIAAVLLLIPLGIIWYVRRGLQATKLNSSLPNTSQEAATTS